MPFSFAHFPLLSFCIPPYMLWSICASSAWAGHFNIALLVVIALIAGCATASQTQGGPLWTGDGGKETSLTILAPTASGLDDAQKYLLDVVRLEFISNISGFSAISVLDWANLQKQYDVLLSGYYDDNAAAGLDLGHLTPTTHILGGNITKTATGYALQMQITRTADKMTTASYSDTFSFADLDNRRGIRRASLDLLGKMGVTLTKSAQQQLSGAERRDRVNAQTAFAQSIASQRGGDEFSAMLNFFDAKVSGDRTLAAEATTRMVTTATTANTAGTDSSMRDSIIGEITQAREAERLAVEQKKALKEVLLKTNSYYTAHQPFEIIPHNKFYVGDIDRKKETVEIHIGVGIAQIKEEFDVLIQLQKQAQSFGFDNWPWQYHWKGLVSKLDSIVY
jgi:hypothetical protein